MAEQFSPIVSLNLIVAFDSNYGIGLNGRLPWPRLDDMSMKHFQSIQLPPIFRNHENNSCE